MHSGEYTENKNSKGVTRQQLGYQLSTVQLRKWKEDLPNGASGSTASSSGTNNNLSQWLPYWNKKCPQWRTSSLKYMKTVQVVYCLCKSGWYPRGVSLGDARMQTFLASRAGNIHWRVCRSSLPTPQWCLLFRARDKETGVLLLGCPFDSESNEKFGGKAPGNSRALLVSADPAESRDIFASLQLGCQWWKPGHGKPNYREGFRTISAAMPNEVVLTPTLYCAQDTQNWGVLKHELNCRGTIHSNFVLLKYSEEFLAESILFYSTLWAQ